MFLSLTTSLPTFLSFSYPVSFPFQLSSFINIMLDQLHTHQEYFFFNPTYTRKHTYINANAKIQGFNVILNLSPLIFFLASRTTFFMLHLLLHASANANTKIYTMKHTSKDTLLLHNKHFLSLSLFPLSSFILPVSPLLPHYFQNSSYFFWR